MIGAGKVYGGIASPRNARRLARRNGPDDPVSLATFLVTALPAFEVALVALTRMALNDFEQVRQGIVDKEIDGVVANLKFAMDGRDDAPVAARGEL